MSLLRRLAGETAVYGFSYILSRVLHYVLLTWYLTRVFNDDPSQYGIYRDLYFYVAVLVVILTFRMETTYFRYARENNAAVTTMSMSFLLTFASVFLIALWVFRNHIAGFIQYPAMTKHIMLLGIVLFFDVLSSVPFAGLRQQNRPLKFLSLKLGSILLNISFVLFFIELLPRLAAGNSFWQQIYTEDKLFYVILANLLASALTFVLLLPLIRKQPLQWDLSFLKRMLKFSWPLVIVGFAGVINQYASIAFQKNLLGEDLTSNLEEGGKYAAAASLALILSLFTTAYNYAAEPFFFAHRDKAEARTVYADAALAYTLIGSVMMLFILAFIDLFQLLLGKNFREGLDVVPILLVSFLLLGIYYNISIWYKLADKTLWGAWIAGTGTVITVVLSFILIRKMGVIGSAWTAFACYLFMVIAAYVTGQKYYAIPYKLFRMFGWITIAVLFYIAMAAIRKYVGEDLAISLAVNSVLVLLYIFLIYRFERSLLKQLARSR
ncbi:MAG TPA: hypothetical protein VMZ69_00130 [Saprospiraceae bacterium]|nr:hypothetical protein [Saprospiraceae bacterium]